MHAVGATGVFQIIEVLWQLQKKWGQFHSKEELWTRYGKTPPGDLRDLQVANAKRGMAISHAGTGSHVTCTILGEA